MTWVNLDRASHELPYSLNNWKNFQLLQGSASNSARHSSSSIASEKAVEANPCFLNFPFVPALKSIPLYSSSVFCRNHQKGICVYSSERSLHARLLKDIYLLSCQYYSPFHYQTPSPFYSSTGRGCMETGLHLFLPNPVFQLRSQINLELPICLLSSYCSQELFIFLFYHTYRGSLTSYSHPLSLLQAHPITNQAI